MFHVGIDISKSKHDCFITTTAGVKITAFTFKNDYDGFQSLKEALTSLGDQDQIKIGFESTGHYGTNLKSFISNLGYTYLEFNPQLTSQFSRATSLRRTKTDKIDAKLIATMLGHVDYKTLHSKFYHINELKELVRARDKYLMARSKELVKLTNVLDKSFPEFKPFFNNMFSKTTLHLLKSYTTKEKISKLTSKHHETLHKLSRGRLTYAKFSNLRSLASKSIGVSSESYTFLIKVIINEYERLSKVISDLDLRIKELYYKTESLIHTVPGIGITTAATIYAEIDNINNFSNPNKLIAFAGLDVSINQSGSKEIFGKIVKRGSSLLRKTIYIYSLSSLKFIPKFNDYYHKKKDEGKHHKVILTHISRKLIRMIYHIEFNKVPFNTNKIS